MDNCSLLDDVFKCFLDTNVFREEHYGLRDMLSKREKRVFAYDHNGRKYSCKVIFKDCYHDMDQLDIRLHNIAYRDDINRPETIWIQCGDGDLPKLRASISAVYSEASIWYRVYRDFMDVEVVSVCNELPRLRISFQKGLPWAEYEERGR